MKLTKLLLATTLAIPAIGYCGFIDWITGYPEVKEKIEQALERKYHGDKFDVYDISYSSNLGGYNFTAKDINRDLKSGGSYYEKNNSVNDNFGIIITNSEFKDLAKPIINKYSSNYLIFGGIDATNPVDQDVLFKKLGNLYQKNLTANEWIQDDHEYLDAALTLYIDIPKSPQGVLDVITLIEQLNNYYRSLHLYSYKLTVVPLEVPKDFNIYQYAYNKSESDRGYGYSDFIGDGDIQKYAWGWIQLYSCENNGKFEKYCSTQYGVKNLKERQKLVHTFTSADRVHNLNDIAQDFHLFTNPGKISMWDEHTVYIKGKNEVVRNYAWNGVRMSYKPLIDSEIYKQALELKNK